MEIGHPLTGHAAEFADIVACRRRGGQRQIHRRAAPPQGPTRRHGHVVHHGDVLQGAEGRQLAAQAQQLIDEILPPHLQKPLVEGAARRLLVGAEGEVHGHVEPLRPAFLRQQQLHGQQGAQGKVLLPRRGLPAVLGIQAGDGVAEHIAAPSTLRRRELRHGFSGGLDELYAAEPLPQGQKLLGEPGLRPALRHVRVAEPRTERGIPERLAPVLAKNGFMGHIVPPFRLF